MLGMHLWQWVALGMITLGIVVMCGALAVRLRRKWKGERVYPCPPTGAQGNVLSWPVGKVLLG
jgi:hypothetical protein